MIGGKLVAVRSHSHERRHRVSWRAIVCSLVAGALAIQGCASRSTVEPAPVEPPRPIRMLAVLPVSMPPGESNTGFGAGHVPIVVPIVASTPHGGSSTEQIVAGTLLSIVIASGIHSVRQGREKAMAEALAQVAFDPAERVESGLLASLEAQRVALVRVTDPRIAAEVRAGRWAELPAGVDGVLDVSIPESGFYSSFRAGGYSPMLLVRASLRRPPDEGRALEHFQYYADWRDAARDRRWITMPASLVYPDLNALKAHASQARAGLVQVADRMVALIVEDVKRSATGQARVD